jgi:hypothetical protein
MIHRGTCDKKKVLEHRRGLPSENLVTASRQKHRAPGMRYRVTATGHWCREAQNSALVSRGPGSQSQGTTKVSPPPPLPSPAIITSRPQPQPRHGFVMDCVCACAWTVCLVPDGPRLLRGEGTMPSTAVRTVSFSELPIRRRCR